MDGIMIESKPLTKDGAAALINVLDKTTVVAASAVNVLELRLALIRIANGVDEVRQVNGKV